MYHPKTRELDDNMRLACQRVDQILEDRYGKLYDLHPNRPSRGETSNPAMDGLFNVGTSFTAGYGSVYGRGYAFQVEIATLEQVPLDVRETILTEAVHLLEAELVLIFPHRSLEVVREGRSYKIVGDFSLGQI